MPALNEHVILEIAQYLDVVDLLSLAHSCSAAFQASRNHYFWRPQYSDSPMGLAAFMPSLPLGPWISYSGDDIRVGVKARYKSTRKWRSERQWPRASLRIRVNGRHSIVEGIPGSRWLFSHHRNSGGNRMVRIIDGKTGICTTKHLNITPGGTPRSQVVACSVQPDEVLIGCSARSLGPNQIAFFTLFSLKLSFNEKDGKRFLEAHQKQLQVWESTPESPKALLTTEFLVLTTTQYSWYVNIYHIRSGRCWTYPEIKSVPFAFLVGQWCLLAVETHREFVNIVAIDLQSLLQSPDVPITTLTLPEGVRFVHGGDMVVGHYSVDITTSEDLLPGGAGDNSFTVMLSDSSYRAVFQIVVTAATNSRYGTVALTGVPLLMPTDSDVLSQVKDSASPKRDGNPIPALEPSHVPTAFTALRSKFEFLIAGLNSQHLLVTLHMRDLDKFGPTRTFEWQVPLTAQEQQSKDEGPKHPGDVDRIRRVSYWDRGTGMLLLAGPALPGGIVEYQTCWF